MWLLNTDTDHAEPELKSYLERDLDSHDEKGIYRYAILSHRWEEDIEELTFHEMRSGMPSHAKKGWYKIDKCRSQAKRDGLNLLWADTCCIDRSSSAELQESINSMYRFYERAAVCYAYLGDVYIDNFEATFTASEWFERGWTMQELIASSNVNFYDVDWQFLGTKHTLSQLIADVTSISQDVLEGKKLPRECSVAQRMSWASKRETTRVEDRAYSLLGIFDVNMPMLYGEGEKAFIRLQEEIIKTSDDHSIFAWTGMKPMEPGLLASSPLAFLHSGNIKTLSLREARVSYTMGNRGLSIKLRWVMWCPDTYLALINCAREGVLEAQMGIFLRRLYEDDQYARVCVSGEDLIDEALTRVEYSQMRLVEEESRVSINVRQRMLFPSETHFLKDRIYGFRFDDALLRTDRKGNDLFTVETHRGDWNRDQRMITVPPGSIGGTEVGVLDISKQRRKIEMIKLGFDSDFNPGIFLAENSAVEARSETGQQYDSPLEVARDQSLDDRTANDIYSWNTIVMSKDGRRFVKPSIKFPIDARNSWRTDGTRVGLWALKGDRINGLDVYLTDARNPQGHAGHVTLRRTFVDGSLIWDLQIDDLLGTLASKMWNKFEAFKK